MSNTFETLKKILVDQYQVDVQLITPESTFSNLNLDSLTLMEFIFSAEDAFNLRIPEGRLGEDLSQITLQKICVEIDILIK